MQFSSIRIDGDKVQLKWEEKIDDGIDKHEFSCDEAPTPAFRSTLDAFSAYVVQLIQAPKEWADGLVVRSLALNVEDKGNLRGLVVTALRKCDKAKGRMLLLNTPYMSEAPKTHNGPQDGWLPTRVLEMIERAEAEAKCYLDGERDQTKLDLKNKGSENAKNVDKRMADAEVSSTRKPRKAKDHEPGVGTIVNPEADVAPTDDALRQLLGSVDRDVPLDAIQRWTSSEREAAQRWGIAQQQQIVGTRKGRMPKEPECVQRDATLPLKADEWTGDPPPKLDEAGVGDVRQAALQGTEG